jgi:hypothetical protein
LKGLEDIPKGTDETGQILSFTLKGVRNIKGFPLPAFINRAERKTVEVVIKIKKIIRKNNEDNLSHSLFSHSLSPSLIIVQASPIF